MFDIPLLINLFISLIELNNIFNWTKEHPLKTSNKRTHIPLFINLFISLIELEHSLKTSNKRIKEHTCKIKIDKII